MIFSCIICICIINRLLSPKGPLPSKLRNPKLTFPLPSCSPSTALPPSWPAHPEPYIAWSTKDTSPHRCASVVWSAGPKHPSNNGSLTAAPNPNANQNPPPQIHKIRIRIPLLFRPQYRSLCLRVQTTPAVWSKNGRNL